MTLFEEIVRDLLLEAGHKPSESDIKDAIEGLHCVSVMYNDQQGGLGKSWRYTYPVAYGPGNGNESSKHYYVRLFMTKGSTKRGQFKWKLLRADRIVSWVTLDETLQDEISNLSSSKNERKVETASLLKRVFSGEEVEGIGKMNTTGDKQIRVIYHCPLITPEPDIDSKTPIEPKTKAVQKPEVEPTQPEAPKEEPKNIDNVGTQGYTQNSEIEKLTAPETVPVYKDDIVQPAAEPTPEEPDIEAPETEPVTKDEVQPENDLTPAFNDMWDRWNKLGKDEEEKYGEKR